MTRKIKIAVFASGSGSNFAAIEEACRKGELNAEIVLMVTNKPEAYRCRTCRKSGHLELRHFNRKHSIQKMHMKKQFLEALTAKLERNGLSLQDICALLGTHLLAAYPSTYRQYPSITASIFSWKRCGWTSSRAWRESDRCYCSSCR